MNRSELITWCEAQLGYCEGANNYNKYAPLVQGAIGWNAQNQPWCSIFVVAGFTQVFGNQLGCELMCTSYGQASAACAQNASCYKSQNRFFTSNPQVGDQIFFYYDGGINHTGIVVSVDGNTVQTIEGNSSDGVRKNTYKTYNSIIAGYGRPDWSKLGETATASTTTTTTTSTVTANNLIPDNTTGIGIAMLQGGLKYLGWDVGRYMDKQNVRSGVDGDAGLQSSMTNNALKLAMAQKKITEEQVKTLLSWN